MCICICVCVSVHAYACVCVYTCAGVYVSAFIFEGAKSCGQNNCPGATAQLIYYACECINERVSVCVCVCVCVRVGGWTGGLKPVKALLLIAQAVVLLYPQRHLYPILISTLAYRLE